MKMLVTECPWQGAVVLPMKLLAFLEVLHNQVFDGVWSELEYIRLLPLQSGHTRQSVGGDYVVECQS
jgi:hypothetical protein